MAQVRRKRFDPNQFEEQPEDEEGEGQPRVRLNPREERMQSRGAVGEDWNQLRNRDPNLEYRWVYTGDKDQGITYYATMGFEPVVKREGGVIAVSAPRSLKDGDEIVVQDNLLMSISKEEYKEIVQWGVFGKTGLAWAEQLERRMSGGRNPRATNDRTLAPGLKGAQARYFAAKRTNELSPE